MRKIQSILIILIGAMLIAGCGKGGAAETTAPVKAEENETKEKDDKASSKKEKKKKERKKHASVPEYCISSPGDVDCEMIHIIDEDGSYKELSRQLEALNDKFVASAYDTGMEEVVHNVCVRRADSKILSFVYEYRESEGEVDYVEIRGHSFRIDSGEELKLSDVIDDEKAFYENLSEKLHNKVMDDMRIMAGEFDLDIADFDAASAISECLNDGRYGWVLDPQGVTFWFENVNALIGHASATVLFAEDKAGVIFNKEFINNAPDEWIMRIPESYSSVSYFDGNDDGTMDEIYWYRDSGYHGDDYIYSGIGVKYNGRYFNSDEICPANEMPWSHCRAYLMHKDNKTVLVTHHYEEAESIWNSFSLEDDFVKSVDTVYAYPEYKNYAELASGWLVPVDMSAIRVYSDHGGDEEGDYPAEILTVSTDASMKISELPDKDGRSSGKSPAGSTKPAGLSKDDAAKIAGDLGGRVCVIECRDYDGDGADEAFVVLGGDDEFGGYLPEKIWFISSEGKTELMRDDFRGLSLYTETDGFYMDWAKENKGFFYGDCGGYGSGWTTFIFSVKDGKPYELDVSMNTEGFYQDKDKPGEFYTLTDNFDNGHAYLRTELIYDSKTGQFAKGKITEDEF